jgi:hypothetical protein
MRATQHIKQNIIFLMYFHPSITTNRDLTPILAQTHGFGVYGSWSNLLMVDSANDGHGYVNIVDNYYVNVLFQTHSVR